MKAIYTLFVLLFISTFGWGQCGFNNSFSDIYYSSNNCNSNPPSSTATICVTYNISLSTGNSSYQLGYTLNGTVHTWTPSPIECKSCSGSFSYCLSIPCNSLIVFFIDTWTSPNPNDNNFCNRQTSQGYNPDGTLPLVDSKFVAEKTGSTINISWDATDDESCLGYELENSFDGLTWKALTWKSNAQPNIPTSYIATDNNSYDGVIYYRLKRVLNDGSSEYSKVISVGSSAGVVVTPNPASDEITLLPGKEISIEHVSIFNAKGNLIQGIENPGKTISVAHLAGGLYFIQIETLENTITQKVIIRD